jgi:hypothetical protein
MDNKQENDFLSEIQQKINKRSGGLYYNKKLKIIKKSLTITSFVVIIVIVLWVLINSVYQRVSLDKKIIQKTPKKVRAQYFEPSSKKEIKAQYFEPLQKKEKESKVILEKQKFKYIFTPSESFTGKDAKILNKIMKKYEKIEENGFNTYKIPEMDIKNILKLMSNINVKISKDKYLDKSNFSKLSIKKEMLDIIYEK